MRTPLVVIALFFLAPTAASSQVKISGRLECVSASGSRSTQIGSRDTHIYQVESFDCVWRSPLIIHGTESKEEVRHLFLEIDATWSRQRSRAIGVMANGDKYETRWLEGRSPAYWPVTRAKGRWMFTRGTGSLRGIEGGGTYERMPRTENDKFTFFSVEGRYRIAPRRRPR